MKTITLTSRHPLEFISRMATESEEFQPEIKKVLLGLASGKGDAITAVLDREYVVEDENGTTTITYLQSIKIDHVQKEAGNEDSSVG